MSKYRVCEVCGKPVDITKHHISFNRTNVDGTRAKRKSYEHVECSDII